MTHAADPTITCPHCKSEVRLTESLAAPLVEATRAQYESKLQVERAAIAKAEAEKARLALKADIDQKAKDLADLKDVLAERDVKLAELARDRAVRIEAADAERHELRTADDRTASVRRQAADDAERRAG